MFQAIRNGTGIIVGPIGKMNDARGTRQDDALRVSQLIE
jgi:hypothetical protein